MQHLFDPIVYTLLARPALWIGLIFTLGLLVGSFLNVVIHRLPIMLDRDWREQAQAMLDYPPVEGGPADDATANRAPVAAAAPDTSTVDISDPPLALAASDVPTVDLSSTPASSQSAAVSDATSSAPAGAARQAPKHRTKYNLVVPRSACPKCGAQITALQNIPVVSYLVLGGKCAGCGTPISIRYPFVELLTATLSALVAWRFGVVWYTAAALALTWSLVALSFIDYDHKILPENITQPLLWGGLLLSLAAPALGAGLPVDPRSSILGAVIGFMSLWTIYHVYLLLTGQEGMGRGDFTLFSALGAWLGWIKLLPIILVAAVAGSIIGGSLILFFDRKRENPIPFGPFLAIAGWIVLMWGDRIVNSWFHLFG